MASIKQISASATLPVDVTGFKEHIGFSVSDTSKDNAFNLLIGAATKEAESFTGCRFMPAIYEYRLPDFKTQVLINPVPVTGINSVKYFDADNNETTMASGTDYYFDIEAEPAEVNFINTPGVNEYRADAVVINFGAGYATADAVPEDIKAAILLAAANLYVNPTDAVKVLPTISERLLRNYRTYNTE